MAFCEHSIRTIGSLRKEKVVVRRKTQKNEWTTTVTKVLIKKIRIPWLDNKEESSKKYIKNKNQ